MMNRSEKQAAIGTVDLGHEIARLSTQAGQTERPITELAQAFKSAIKQVGDPTIEKTIADILAGMRIESTYNQTDDVI